MPLIPNIDIPLTEIFIETGTYLGNGIKWALNRGYKKIYSIELINPYYNDAKNKFQENNEVIIINGNSTRVLPELIKNINKPITFWLDAHYMKRDPIQQIIPEELRKTPIIDELKAIRGHHLKNHIIMIDDIREYKKTIKTLNEIINLLKDLNINYIDDKNIIAK